MKESFRYSPETGEVVSRTISDDFHEYNQDPMSVVAHVNGKLALSHREFDYRDVRDMNRLIDNQVAWLEGLRWQEWEPERIAPAPPATELPPPGPSNIVVRTPSPLKAPERVEDQ